MTKDKHTINLILISSRWFNSFLLEIVHDEVILVSSVSSFIFSGVPSFLGYLVAKLHLITSRLHLVLSTSLSFYHPFITGVLHGGSTWWFVKDSFHSSIVLQDFSRSYDLPGYTLNKHGAQHMFCFEELKYSSSCIPKCNSFYLIFWGGDMSFLTISVRASWFKISKSEIF